MFRIVAVAAFTLATAIGTLLPAHDAAAKDKPSAGYVRAQAIESGAPRNDHPAQIGEGELRAALASIRVKGGTDDTAFDDAELAELAPQLAAALAKASPSEDVTFAVFGKHGIFGKVSPTTVTTGRVFVQGGQLNLILGMAQTRYDSGYAGGVTELNPGQRGGRVERFWQVSAEGATVVDKRGDWLRFDLSRLAAAAKPAEPPREARRAEPARPAVEAAPPKPADADARYQEIQSRLKALDRLKADGLITEEEYRERRRAILQSL